jgi:hypothetical protein
MPGPVRTKNDCDGDGQQQFTQPSQWVSLQWQSAEKERRGTKKMKREEEGSNMGGEQEMRELNF